jgi:hypothetical protein
VARILTAIIECTVCWEEFDGLWVDDSIDEQDRAEAPTEEQQCPNGHQFEAEYPGWSFRSEAG